MLACGNTLLAPGSMQVSYLNRKRRKSTGSTRSTRKSTRSTRKSTRTGTSPARRTPVRHLATLSHLIAKQPRPRCHHKMRRSQAALAWSIDDRRKEPAGLCQVATSFLWAASRGQLPKQLFVHCSASSGRATAVSSTSAMTRRDPGKAQPKHWSACVRSLTDTADAVPGLAGCSADSHLFHSPTRLQCWPRARH